jgi:hypothetical protein
MSRISEADSILLLDAVYYPGPNPDFENPENPYLEQMCPSIPLSEDETKGIMDSLASAVEDNETPTDPFIDTVAHLAFTTSADDQHLILSLINEGFLIYCTTAPPKNGRYFMEYVPIGRLRCRELYQALLPILETRSASINAGPTCVSDVRYLSTILKKLLGTRPPLENGNDAEQAVPGYPPQSVGSPEP